MVPSSRATIACDLRTRRLKRLDLPAFVCPMIATTGNLISGYIITKLTNAVKCGIMNIFAFDMRFFIFSIEGVKSAVLREG